MGSQDNIPSKLEVMKTRSYDFLENERTQWGITEEKMGPEQIVEARNDFNFINETVLKCDNSRTESSAQKPTVVMKTESRTEDGVSSEKRYTTVCFLEPMSVPYWYTESLTIRLGMSKNFEYDEKVYHQDKLRPIRWSETMTTDVKTVPKNIMTETYIPVEDFGVHYMSLEPQQMSATVAH